MDKPVPPPSAVAITYNRDDSAPRVVAKGRGMSYVKYELVRTYVGVVADVEVDRASGEIRVPKVYLVHDCGQIINPDGLKNQLEGNVIQPLAVGRSVRLHPIVTIAAVAVGATLGGVVGAFVAVPIVAVVYRSLEQLRKVNVERAQDALVVPDVGPPSGQAEVVARAR